MSIYRLFDACCEVYDRGSSEGDDWWPHEGKTFCNEAVQYISGKMGYMGFGGMLANQMVETMRTGGDFDRIEIPEAQALANAGKLVIAGIVSDPHGHVVVIRPGEEAYSPKWGCNVPKVVNIGQENFINNPLSWVLHDKPEVFVFKRI